VKLTVNGEAREVPAGTTVAELLKRAGIAGDGRRGMAIAVDAEVVPRSAWEDTELSDGQQVELLRAIQGG
jgi:sulfur carrier protein